MKILMLNPFFHPYKGGTEKHLLEVTKRLAKRHEVTVLTARLPGTKPEEEINGVRVVRTPARIIRNLPPPLPPPMPLMPRHNEDVERLIKENDIVHGHNRFIYGLTEGRLVRKYGRKMCWTLHNARPQGIDFLTDFCGGLFDAAIGARILRSCDGVLAVSRNTLEMTMPRHHRGITGVAYNGVDTKAFHPTSCGGMREKFGLQEKNVVMTNCRLVEQKGIKYLIEAMRGLDAQLFVFGRGPLLGKLKVMAPDAVFASEFLGEHQLAELYGACDVFVLPSLWEPFGMVLTEAMACAKPVICTDAGGMPEIVTKDCGFVVPHANPAALREKIELLLGDPALGKKMGAAGRKRSEKVFSWDKTIEAYEKMYSRI